MCRFDCPAKGQPRKVFWGFSLATTAHASGSQRQAWGKPGYCGKVLKEPAGRRRQHPEDVRLSGVSGSEGQQTEGDLVHSRNG